MAEAEAGAEVRVEWDRFLGSARRGAGRTAQALGSPAARRRRLRPACRPRRRRRFPQECSRRVSSAHRCRHPERARFSALGALSPGAEEIPSFRSPPRRTIDPPGPRASNWFPFVAASAQGTSAAASRSTDAGSGSERPLAAKSGIGRSTPTKTSRRSQRRRQWAVRKARCCRAAVMPQGEGAFLQPKRRSPLQERPTPDG